MHSKVGHCRLCGSTKLSCVIPMQPIPIGEHYSIEKPTHEAERFPIDIYQCTECNAVQTQDDIDPSFLWKDYTYFSSQTTKILEHFSAFAKETVETYFQNDCETNQLSALDIGSNDGSLLLAFKKYGFNVQGFDPAETVVELALKNGVPSIQDLFTKESGQYHLGNKRFDIITAFNVFAHSANMPSMLEGVKNHLSDEGIFCFEVQYLEDISSKKILGTFFHEHMIHYSYHSAKKFLSTQGLEIIDYTRNNIQNGSIIFFASHSESKRARKSTTKIKLEELLKAENNANLNTFKWSNDFNKYISDVRNQLENFVKNENIDVLAGYGAARSGPTLAIQFGLENLINCLLDDHHSKVNKYSPFKSLLVQKTDSLSAKVHPVSVILAYIHYKPIIRNNLQYLSDGGKFLLLWPKFEVVTYNNVEDYI